MLVIAGALLEPCVSEAWCRISAWSTVDTEHRHRSRASVLVRTCYPLFKYARYEIQ